MSALGHRPAQEDAAPGIALCEVPEPCSRTALKMRLLLSSAVLVASLLPMRETDAFTAAVITASGSRRAGTG